MSFRLRCCMLKSARLSCRGDVECVECGARQNAVENILYTVSSILYKLRFVFNT